MERFISGQKKNLLQIQCDWKPFNNRPFHKELAETYRAFTCFTLWNWSAQRANFNMFSDIHPRAATTRASVTPLRRFQPFLVPWPARQCHWSKQLKQTGIQCQRSTLTVAWPQTPKETKIPNTTIKKTENNAGFRYRLSFIWNLLVVNYRDDDDDDDDDDNNNKGIFWSHYGRSVLQSCEKGLWA